MEDQAKPKGRPWIDAAAIFSLAVGLLYLYGETFVEGYLREFVLTPHLFAESFEKTLITGLRLLLHAPRENFKSILVFLLAYWGIFGILWVTFRIVRKKRTLLALLSLAITFFTFALISGIFFIFYNYALREGRQSANQLKRQMDTESNFKGERGKLPKAIILYDGHGNDKPKQLMGYIIAHSPNGFAIYVEGKVNFIPMSRIIQVSFPVK